ncbi:hypothetical protein QR680_004815 [Steinernema hermaphroditum]|uniref:Uncharacterized protein n=1 Tax=Steinernema hermaphroditum TaxID=289476 RepID=A0AA39HPX2_9BILA|nr:hypothetical protein QR680_004815 [Steinernema hermaphroditum]
MNPTFTRTALRKAVGMDFNSTGACGVAVCECALANVKTDCAEILVLLFRSHPQLYDGDGDGVPKRTSCFSTSVVVISAEGGCTSSLQTPSREHA